MSVTEIINELPKLTEMERRAVREKLLELAATNAGGSLHNQAALEGALKFDKVKKKPIKITSLPDFAARRNMIFPRPISKAQARKFDKMLRGG
jgi:hypothetical protein